MLVRRTLQRNFGDDLNMFLIKCICNAVPIAINNKYKNKENQSIYMVIGSVLGWADRNTEIWGTGLMSPTNIPKEKPKKIYAVRGKLTRQELLKNGISCPEVYGDPCLLYPRFYNPVREKKYELGIIPHYVDKNSVYLDKFKNNKDILIIDVQEDPHKIIDNILSCKKIASSCLHGIIGADGYGIPSIWIKLSDKVLGNGFKFHDYFSSVNRTDIEPLIISLETTIKDIENKFKPYKIEIDLDKLYNACPFRR